MAKRVEKVLLGVFGGADTFLERDWTHIANKGLGTKLLLIGFVELFSAAWFFSLGAIFGSFLNVVVYRMPRGSEVVFRPSACPYCTAKIKPRDNVPILGWLLLGGRCRRCRLPISARYPLVELAAALIFLSLYFVIIWSGGKWLPLSSPNPRSGALDNLFSPRWDLISIYALCCWLMCHLLATSLMNWDGHKVPGRLVVLTTLVGFGLPMSFPAARLHSTNAFQGMAGISTRPLLETMQTGLIGLVTGVVLGVVMTGLRALTKCDSRPASVVSAIAVTGLYLGWPATILVSLASLLLSLVWRVLGDPLTRSWHVPLVGGVTICAWVYLLSWRWSEKLISLTELFFRGALAVIVGYE